MLAQKFELFQITLNSFNTSPQNFTLLLDAERRLSELNAQLDKCAKDMRDSYNNVIRNVEATNSNKLDNDIQAVASRTVRGGYDLYDKFYVEIEKHENFLEIQISYWGKTMGGRQSGPSYTYTFFPNIQRIDKKQLLAVINQLSQSGNIPNTSLLFDVKNGYGYFLENERWICKGTMKHHKYGDNTIISDDNKDKDMGTAQNLLDHLIGMAIVLNYIDKNDPVAKKSIGLYRLNLSSVQQLL